MPKKNELETSKTARPVKGARMPPPLSSDLIAKLQAAVEAEQRKRLQPPIAESETDR